MNGDVQGLVLLARFTFKILSLDLCEDRENLTQDKIKVARLFGRLL
jgi:hypothetical protein